MPYFPTVFIASSDKPRDQIPDLRNHAKNGVLEAQMNPIMFEHYKKNFTGGSPLQLSREMIDVADIFVGFYTGIYGRDIHEGQDWAEFEFDYARSQGKPMLLFMANDRPADDEKFKAFERKIGTIFYQSFTDGRALQTEITRTLGAKYNHLRQQTIVSAPLFGQPIPSPQYDADIFMIMPFRDNLTQIYETCIKPTVESLGYTIKRGDDFFSKNDIAKEIWSATYRAKAVIGDCTGQNANVFYELGIAHTLGKDFILLTQNEKDVPFDLRHYRYKHYDPNNLLDLRDYLIATLRTMNLDK